MSLRSSRGRFRPFFFGVESISFSRIHGCIATLSTGHDEGYFFFSFFFPLRMVWEEDSFSLLRGTGHCASPNFLDTRFRISSLLLPPSRIKGKTSFLLVGDQRDGPFSSKLLSSSFLVPVRVGRLSPREVTLNVLEGSSFLPLSGRKRIPHAHGASGASMAPGSDLHGFPEVEKVSLFTAVEDFFSSRSGKPSNSIVELGKQSHRGQASFT